MTEDLNHLFREAAATARPVVHGIGEDDLGRRTPCPEFDVRGLLNHLLHVVVEFQKLARREKADFGTTPDYLTGDWKARFDAETDALTGEWSRPGTLDGVSPGMGLPQWVVAAMALLDLTVHSWDLARATGQAHRPSPDVIAMLWRFEAEMGDMARKFEQIGPRVDVPDAAPEFDRLLGALGRDPQWSP